MVLTTEFIQPSCAGKDQEIRVTPMRDPPVAVGIVMPQPVPSVDTRMPQGHPLKVDAKHDPVKRPAHYTYGEIEVIDFIEQVVAGYPPEIGYHIGNVLKYIARAPHKGKLSEDLCKSEYYLKRAINKSINLKPKRD